MLQHILWTRVVCLWVLFFVFPCLETAVKASPQDRPHLESEIRKAHVICVVYAIDNPNSFDRIPTYWLPHFRQLGVNVNNSDVCLFIRF